MWFAIGVGALTAISAYSASQQAARQSDAQAALYEQAGTRQRELTAIRETQQRAAYSKLQGQQRARMAASGIEPSTGSALLTQTETARDLELRALQERSQGLYEATSTEHQGALLRWQSRETRATAISGALMKGAIAGGSTYMASGRGFGSSSMPAGATDIGNSMPWTASPGSGAGSQSFGGIYDAGPRYTVPSVGYDYYGE